MTVIHVGIPGTYHKIDYIEHEAWPVYIRLNTVTGSYVESSTILHNAYNLRFTFPTLDFTWYL